MLNYVCGSYFGLGRTDIVYSLCYFVAGGLVYQHRDELEIFSRRYQWVSLGMAAASVILYFLMGGNTITMLFVSVSFLIYAIGRNRGVLANRFTRFVSSISMEIYLCHMVLFRVIEKMGLHKAFGDGWVQYAVTVAAVLVGAAVFAVVMQRIFGVIGKRIRSNGKNEAKGNLG